MLVSSSLIRIFRRSPLKYLQEHMRVVMECVREVPPLFDALIEGDKNRFVVVKDRIFECEAAVVSIVQSGGEVAQKAALPVWVLLLGGAAIVVDLSTMGYRVMKTIGTRITELTPSRGYCATLAAATVVVPASLFKALVPGPPALGLH